jgi:cell division septation protein DedD
MFEKVARKLALVAVAFLSACASEHSAGYGPVRIETYPLDGTCILAGNGYTMRAQAPADLVVPLSAAPVTVTCETESGYKGTETLGSNYDPWSPANVGSLGLGYLVDQTAGSGRRYPELLRVTMIFMEAGKPEDVRGTDTAATGPEISEQGDKLMASKEATMAPQAMEATSPAPSSADSAPAMAKTIPEREKANDSMAMPAGNEGGLPAPPTKMQSEAGVPAPPAKPAEPATAEPMTALPATPPMPKAETKPKMDGIRIHLSSFKERANAERSWQSLSRAHGSLLRGLSASIETVDLGAKGKFHRVYAGPLQDSKSARDLCRKLKAKKVYCRPVAAGAK